MPFKIRVIKNETDYKEALAAVRELMLKNPAPESEDAEKLSIIATLVEDYEKKTFPESLPDPVDAILFRMEQQGLKPKDLTPYLGSRSKVSEVLSRKRPLSLAMIRSLEEGLGIPAKVLLKEVDEFRSTENMNWARFPLKEMLKRGYFSEATAKAKNLELAVKTFFESISHPDQVFGMLRKTNYRSSRPMDRYALASWSTKVIQETLKDKPPTNYKKGTINIDFMRKVARLSTEENGPLLAVELLKENGISLIIEPHLPQTYLDGATIMLDKRHPIIALTLRKDLLDNFWFSLMHELAHIILHSENNCNFFYDDLDSPDVTDLREREADSLAGEALVPSEIWEDSPARLIPSAMAAEGLARELGVHIVIVAGKMRFESGKYMYLNKIINKERIRHLFPDKPWN